MPSIVIAYFNKNMKSQAILKVNWTELLSNKSGDAIHFEPVQDYISSVAFTSIYEFTDPKNKVYLNESPEKPIRHGFDEVIWDKQPVMEKDTVLFKGRFLNGSIAFKVGIENFYLC